MTTIATFEGGKYAVTQHDDGKLTAERYREPWRDLTGDKLVGAMLDEVVRLRMIVSSESAESADSKYSEVWTTRNNRILTVDQMTEDHVRATLNMVLCARRKRIELKAALLDIQELCDQAIAEDHKWGS